jgi:hypothetical protein
MELVSNVSQSVSASIVRSRCDIDQFHIRNANNPRRIYSKIIYPYSKEVFIKTRWVYLILAVIALYIREEYGSNSTRIYFDPCKAIDISRIPSDLVTKLVTSITITNRTVFILLSKYGLLNYSLLRLGLLICTYTKCTFNTIIKCENRLITRRSASRSQNPVIIS